MHQNSLKKGKLFLILLNDGWMVDLAMNIFEFITKFLVLWHPWHPWVCFRSVYWKWNLKQIEACPPTCGVSVLNIILADILKNSVIWLHNIGLVPARDCTDLFAASKFYERSFCGVSIMKVIIAEILKISVVTALSMVAASAIHGPLCSLHIL